MTTELLQNIKILILDVDGIMTDGTITYSSSGEELKAFNTKDGLGLRLLIDSGIQTGVITARESSIVERRCKELKIDYIFQGIKNKLEPLKVISKKFSLDEICYMGDDLIDIPVLKAAGVGITVPEASKEVHDSAEFITSQHGGKGAVREVCELILKARNKWDEAIKHFKCATL